MLQRSTIILSSRSLRDNFTNKNKIILILSHFHLKMQHGNERKLIINTLNFGNIPAIMRRWVNVGFRWPTIYDVGPTVNQRWPPPPCISTYRLSEINIVHLTLGHLCFRECQPYVQAVIEMAKLIMERSL